MVAPPRRSHGTRPGSAFGGCSYSHQGKAKKHSWAKTPPRPCCSGTSPAPATAACSHLQPPSNLLRELPASLSTPNNASSVVTDWYVMAQPDQYPFDTGELVGRERGRGGRPEPERAFPSMPPLSASNLPCCSLNPFTLWLPGNPVPRGSGAPACEAGRCLCSTRRPTGTAARADLPGWAWRVAAGMSCLTYLEAFPRFGTF